MEGDCSFEQIVKARTMVSSLVYKLVATIRHFIDLVNELLVQVNKLG